jgi:putative FmdB family regulatory protein
MARYDALCNECEAQFEFVASVAAYREVPPCPLCNGTARRIITQAPQGFVKGKFEAFKSPIDGSVIATASDLQEHNKRNNVVNIHDGYDEAKVLKGDFGAPEPDNNAEEVARDVQEAIHDVTHGYVPTIGVQDDD